MGRLLKRVDLVPGVLDGVGDRELVVGDLEAGARWDGAGEREEEAEDGEEGDGDEQEGELP